MEIIPQTPAMVRADWDYFANAIEVVARKAQESFTPEQVMNALIANNAAAFYVYECGHHRGVLILTDHVDRYTGKTVIHVDMLYLNGPSVIHEMTELLNVIASKYEFDVIEFRSPRKGWFKYLSDAGFKSCATFTKEL